MATEKELNLILADIQPEKNLLEEEEEEKNQEVPLFEDIVQTPTTEEEEENQISLTEDSLNSIVKDRDIKKTFKGPSFYSADTPFTTATSGELPSPEKIKTDAMKFKDDLTSLYDSFTGFFTKVIPSGIAAAYPTILNAIDVYKQRSMNQEIGLRTGTEKPPASFVSPNPFVFSDIEIAVKQEEFRQFQEDVWDNTPNNEKLEIMQKFFEDYGAIEERIDERENYINSVYMAHGLGKDGRAAASGITSFSLMVPALAATAYTRNPKFAYSVLPAFGFLESSSAYRESLQGGVSHREAADAANLSAVFEVGTEMISLPFVTRGLGAFAEKNKDKLKNFLLNGFATVGTELGGENLNTFLQETNKAVRGVKNELNIAWNSKDDPNYKGPSWIDVLQENARMTTIATLVGAGGIVTVQGGVAYTPEIKSFLNSLDPNIARKVARQLDMLSKEVESSFHAVDDTFLDLAKFKDTQNILGRNFGRFSTSEPIDLESSDIDQLLNPSRESFQLGAPDFLVDERLVQNILNNDKQISELSEDEKALASLYTEVLSEDMGFDVEDFLLTNKNVLKIIGAEPNEVLDQDAFNQKVEEEAANLETRIAQTEKQTAKENLESDLNTLNKFLNYFKQESPFAVGRKNLKDEERFFVYDSTLEQLKQGEKLQLDTSFFNKTGSEIPEINFQKEKLDQIKEKYIFDPIERMNKNELQYNFDLVIDGDYGVELTSDMFSEIPNILDDTKDNPEFYKKIIEENNYTSVSRTPNRVIDSETSSEQTDEKLAKMINTALELGVPEKIFKGVSGIHIHKGYRRKDNFLKGALGLYYAQRNVITLSEGYFNNTQNEKDLIFAGAETLIHELGHHVDFQWNQRSDDYMDDYRGKSGDQIQNVALSGNSPLFKIPDFGKERKLFLESGKPLGEFEFKSGGEVFNELYNMYRIAGENAYSRYIDIELSEDAAIDEAGRDLNLRTAQSAFNKEGLFFAYPFEELFINMVYINRIDAFRKAIKEKKIEANDEISRYINDVGKFYERFGLSQQHMGVPPKKGDEFNFPQFIKSELFAQAFALKYTNNEFFKEAAPRTNQLIEEIEDAIRLDNFDEISDGLRTAFRYDSSQPDFKIFRINSAYFDPRDSYQTIEESSRVGRDDNRNEESKPQDDSTTRGQEDSLRPEQTEGQSEPIKIARDYKDTDLKFRDESSGHAKDFVPPQYGPPAHNLNEETTEELSPRGDSVFSFDAGENYENLQYFLDGRYEEEKELINKLKEIRGNPDAILTVYRAAPTSELRYGDLVTLTKADAEFEVEQSKITNEEIAKLSRERFREQDIRDKGAIDLEAEKMRDLMDSLVGMFGMPEATPSKLHTYEIRAGDIRFDGNGGLTRWGFFPSNVVNIKGDKPAKLISSKREESKGPTRTQEEINADNALFDAIESGQIRKPPEGPPPPPKGPDPDGDFSIPQLGFYKDLVEYFNIKVANRFGRQWTVEESMIEQFGEAGVVERLKELGLDPDAKDWRVTTQTDIYQGKVKDLLRDLQEVYYEPMLKFLTLNAINETKYNHFVYSLHAPERNDYLPTKFTENIAEVEEQIKRLEANPNSLKQELTNARRKLTTLKNKMKKSESGSGMTTEQAIENLDSYGVEYKNGVAIPKNKKGEKYLEAYENFHKPMIEYMRKVYTESGLITQERISDWNERYNYYVPLKGFAEDTLIDPITGRNIQRIDTSNRLIKSQMTVSGQMVREAKGRESLADSPLQQSVVDAISALVQSEKNVIVKSLADLSRAFPNDQFWLVVEEAGQLESVDAAWDKTKGKSRVGFKEDGVQKYVEIYDERLAKGFDDFDNTITGFGMKTMRYATRYLSMVNTSLDPAFMINNFIRDVQTAYFNLLAEEEITNGRAQGLDITKKYFTSKNILHNSALLIKFEKNKTLANKEMREEMSEMQRNGEEINLDVIKQLGQKYGLSEQLILKNAKMLQFKKYGGETGYIDQKNVEQMTKEFETLRDIYSGSFKGKAKDALYSSLAIIERFNSGVENAARFTAFEGYIEMIGGIDVATPKDFEKAAVLAKNLTINFNRMGTMGPNANALYMFFNASIQGSVNVFRGLLTKDKSSRKVKAAASLGLVGSLATMWNILYSAEDEEDGVLWYKKIPDWEKQTKFIFMLPDVDLSKGKVKVEKWGTASKYYVISNDGERKLPIGIGIPKPYGYAFLHDIGRITTEFALGKTLDNYDVSFQEASRDLAESLLHNYAPLTFSDRESFGEIAITTLTPSVGKPFANWLQNKDHFGSPIKTSEDVRDLIGDTMPRSYNQSRKALGFTKEMTQFMNDLTGGNQFYSGAVDIDPRTLQYFMDEATGGLGRTAFRFYRLGESFINEAPLPKTDILGLRRVVAGPRDYVDAEILEKNISELEKFKGAIEEFRDTQLEEEKMSETEEEFLERKGAAFMEMIVEGSKISREAKRNEGLVKIYDKTIKNIKESNKKIRQLNLDYQVADDFDTKMDLETEMKEVQLEILRYKKNFNRLFNEYKKDN